MGEAQGTHLGTPLPSDARVSHFLMSGQNDYIFIFKLCCFFP